MSKPKITIVGGGTAGLITALILKVRLEADVKMIVPNDIGIIGVGEGSTEHWATFIEFIGDTLTNSLIKTKGTIKSGIMFEGWTPNRGDYIHSIFGDYTNKVGMSDFIATKFMGDGWTNRDFIGPELNQNVIADYYGPDQKRQEAGGYFQFHFNTNELNKYLTEQANNWGIEIVDDKVLEVMQDETGISEVKGEKDNYKSDFWIDSTGFRRVLMTPLGAKWVSYGDMLPLKEAIAFPTKELDYYPMHTQALAMKAGWKWRIPTYGRFGNGYIYDTNFITKDQAYDEVCQLMEEDVEIGKHIKFTPGKLDKVAIKNCVAIGLSGNFLEPLEATSIGSSIQQAFSLMHLLIDGKLSDYDREEYNKGTDILLDNMRDFVALHYINENRSSDFWKHCATLPRPETLKTMMTIWKERPMTGLDMARIYGQTEYLMFSETNFNHIAYFHGLLTSEVCKKYNDNIAIGLSESVYQKEYIRTLQFRFRENTSIDVGIIPHEDYIRELHRLNGDYKSIKYHYFLDRYNNMKMTPIPSDKDYVEHSTIDKS